LLASGGKAKIAKNAFIPLTVAMTPFCLFVAVIKLLHYFFTKKINRNYQRTFSEPPEIKDTPKFITDFVCMNHIKVDQFSFS